jgi:transposase
MRQVAMSDQEIVRRHKTIWAATALGPRLADRFASEMPELVNLANGLQRERSAVQNTLILPYSNGLVEGRVARLKLLKRQSYGSAKLELLHQRMRHAAYCINTQARMLRASQF